MIYPITSGFFGGGVETSLTVFKTAAAPLAAYASERA